MRGRAAAEVGALDDAVQVGLAEAELRRLEQRMAGAAVAERIEVGDEVAELAVGVDQVEDADDGLGAAPGGRAATAADAATVRARAVRTGAVAVRGHLEAGEEQRPALVDGARVGPVASVLLLDVVRVRTAHEIEVGHDPHPFSLSGAQAATAPADLIASSSPPDRESAVFLVHCPPCPRPRRRAPMARSSSSDVVAMILAGGEGKRLYPLTRDRAKPAVPFGGRYRIIDFVLSNFVNSGIFKISVLTQYKSAR